jgi:AAA+ superfamily predicted ATPase
MNTEGLFENIITFPDPEYHRRYGALVGLDAMKERLEKEAEALLRPDLLEKWSIEKHGTRLPALDLMLRRPPLFIFAGDVGTGKTELASTFGDRLARATRLPVELFSLSLRARGTGAVGEMTKLISDAFRHLRSHSAKKNSGGKRGGSTILLIDEADALAQSRQLAQMHHEDRAGVNALIRGIDDIANDQLACLTIMCTNRLQALDPAVQRRAAVTFQFERPGMEMRMSLLSTYLAGIGLTGDEIRKLGELLGSNSKQPYGHTFSDITQRFVPALILTAYPSKKVSMEIALEVMQSTPPTPPFTAEL